ncbi:MAG: hypothetical protein U5L05_14500 [Rubrivivax sp.]|nr:hypothetical protein [Rubrivivax sp.]
MRSSESIEARRRWFARGGAGLWAVLLAACTAVPAPGAGRLLPDCAVAGLQGEASRRTEFEALRRSIEAGTLQRVAALPGPATCVGQVDAEGSIRIDYRYADGSVLQVLRQSRIESTEFNLRFAQPRTGPVQDILVELERAAFGAAGCGIDWQRATTEPAGDASRSVDTVYRGEVCNCQARVRRDDQGRVVLLALRSAC